MVLHSPSMTISTVGGGGVAEKQESLFPGIALSRQEMC